MDKDMNYKFVTQGALKTVIDESIVTIFPKCFNPRSKLNPNAKEFVPKQNSLKLYEPKPIETKSVAINDGAGGDRDDQGQESNVSVVISKPQEIVKHGAENKLTVDNSNNNNDCTDGNNANTTKESNNANASNKNNLSDDLATVVISIDKTGDNIVIEFLNGFVPWKNNVNTVAKIDLNSNSLLTESIYNKLAVKFFRKLVKIINDKSKRNVTKCKEGKKKAKSGYDCQITESKSEVEIAKQIEEIKTFDKLISGDFNAAADDDLQLALENLCEKLGLPDAPAAEETHEKPPLKTASKIEHKVEKLRQGLASNLFVMDESRNNVGNDFQQNDVGVKPIQSATDISHFKECGDMKFEPKCDPDKRRAMAKYASKIDNISKFELCRSKSSLRINIHNVQRYKAEVISGAVKKSYRKVQADTGLKTKINVGPVDKPAPVTKVTITNSKMSDSSSKRSNSMNSFASKVSSARTRVMLDMSLPASTNGSTKQLLMQGRGFTDRASEPGYIKKTVFRKVKPTTKEISAMKSNVLDRACNKMNFKLKPTNYPKSPRKDHQVNGPSSICYGAAKPSKARTSHKLIPPRSNTTSKLRQQIAKKRQKLFPHDESKKCNIQFSQYLFK